MNVLMSTIDHHGIEKINIVKNYNLVTKNYFAAVLMAKNIENLKNCLSQLSKLSLCYVTYAIYVLRGPDFSSDMVFCHLMPTCNTNPY